MVVAKEQPYVADCSMNMNEVGCETVFGKLSHGLPCTEGESCGKAASR